jgi:transcriptional regulator with XRE-family HTH domain
MPQNRLRRLRLARDLTLEQVSHATGISASTLHAVENQERGDMLLGTAFRLAQFYGLPVADIWQPLCDQVCQEVTQAPSPRGTRTSETRL